MPYWSIYLKKKKHELQKRLVLCLDKFESCSVLYLEKVILVAYRSVSI